MRTKFLLPLILSCTTAFCASATDNNDIKKEINKIKKNSQYIYAESTASTEEEARLFAEEVLLDEINSWVDGQRKYRNKPNLVVNNKKEMWVSMSMPRGNMYRFFVYVKKSDIIPGENSQILTAETNKYVSDNNENMNVTSYNDVKRVEYSDTATDREPSEKTLVTVTEKAETSNMLETVNITVPPVINEIAGHRDYTEMASMIMDMKKAGKIKKYGRIKSLDNPDLYYMFVYNKKGEVVAVLTPGKERFNIFNGNPDSLSNYKGCGAIGVDAGN